MTFYWPHFLWLLVIPLAATWPRRRSNQAAQPIAESDRILRGHTEASGVRLTGAGGALTPRSQFPRLWIAVAFGIVALARPQWGKIEEPVFSQSREILVALDLSRSMLTPDVPPSRLERAKLLTRGLLETLSGERLGLLVFSGTAFLQCPLSSDYEILREFLPELDPSFLPEGGSNYDALLDAAIEAFSQEGGADRFLIILSDGEATDDQWKARIPELKKKGVRVIGLGIGTAAGAIVPDGKGGFVKDRNGAVVLSKLESGTLRELAQATSGTYSDASSWVDLNQLIQSTIASAQKGKFTDATRVRLMERFPWVLAPALALLFWSLIREFPIRPKPRSLPLANSESNPKTNEAKKAGASAALVGLLLVWHLIAPTPVTAAEQTEDSAAAPLSALTRELSGAQRVEPKDWHRFAQATIDYGRRRRESGGDVSEQAIRDGIAATLEGEARDPKAADWEKLRQQLREYLKPTPTPTPPPQQSPSPSPSPSPSGQPSPSPQPQDQSGQGNQNQPSPSPQPPSGSPEKKDPQQNKDQQNGDQKGQATPPPQQSPKQDPGKSAFGDMQDGKPTPPPPPTRPPETQKVGGNSATRKAPTGPSPDPQLSAALQKLEQIRNQDSPAQLYQLMQPSPPASSNTDKDW